MLPKPDTCRGCPFYDAFPDGFVPDNVPAGAKVIFVAQNPGATEEAQGRPLVGQTGQVLRRSYIAPHLPGVPVGYANVLKCRARSRTGHRSNELPPPGSELWRTVVDHCSQYFDETLRQHPDALVVLMGDHAIRARLGWAKLRAKSLHMRGSYITPSIYTMEHPALLAPSRSPQLHDLFTHDMARVGKLASGWRPPAYQDDFRIIDDYRDLYDWLAMSNGRIALDLETRGRTFNVDMVGLARSSTAACICPMPDEKLEHALADWITQKDYAEIIVHYGEGLELTWLRGLLGDDVWRRTTIHDTHKLFHAWDPEYAKAGAGDKQRKMGGGSGALAFLQSLYTWRPYHKHLLPDAERRQDMAAKRHYCMLDCVVTWEIFDRLSQQMQEECPDAWTAYNRDGRTLPVVMQEMSRRGIAVDVQRFADRRRLLRDNGKHLAAACIAEFGPDIAPKGKHAKTAISLQGVVRVLQERGVKIPRAKKITRKDGQPSIKFDRETRKRLLSVIPGLDTLNDYFETQDTLSDFYKDGIADKDGVCRPHWSGFLASWRFRCTGPNLTQWPKSERGVFIARPGYTLAEFDTVAGEYQWFAAVCQDPALLEMFRQYNATRDVRLHPHVVNASVLFHTTVDEAVTWKETQSPHKARYTFAKNYIFRYMNSFEGGVDSLRQSAAKAGLAFSRKDIAAFDKTWDDRFPVANKWRRAFVEAAYRTNVTVHRAWGYRRLYHGYGSGVKNEILDSEWQSGIAGIVNRVILAVWDRYGIAPCVNAHDGLLYELLKDQWEALARWIYHAFVEPVPALNGSIIPVDVAVGDRWGFLEGWKPC